MYFFSDIIGTVFGIATLFARMGGIFAPIASEYIPMPTMIFVCSISVFLSLAFTHEQKNETLNDDIYRKKILDEEILIQNKIRN